MSSPIYKWIIVYDDGNTEEKWGASLYDFADDLVEIPVAIIRNGWECPKDILSTMYGIREE